jgi:hypothetical protein
MSSLDLNDLAILIIGVCVLVAVGCFVALVLAWR